MTGLDQNAISKMNILLSILISLSIFLVVVTSIQQLDVTDEVVVEEALFALRELAKLSDSKIYDSLELTEIISAELDQGIYHENIIFRVILASPYFKSGNSTEEFELVVMTHKTDKVKTLAIDNFPSMREDAIEEYWIKKVEHSRKEKEIKFRQMYLESIFDSNDMMNQQIETADEAAVQALFVKWVNAFGETAISNEIAALSEEVQPRLVDRLLIEEKELSKMTPHELFQTSINQNKASDFQVYRSKQILNALLLKFAKL